MGKIADAIRRQSEPLPHPNRRTWGEAFDDDYGAPVARWISGFVHDDPTVKAETRRSVRPVTDAISKMTAKDWMAMTPGGAIADAAMISNPDDRGTAMAISLLPLGGLLLKGKKGATIAKAAAGAMDEPVQAAVKKFKPDPFDARSRLASIDQQTDEIGRVMEPIKQAKGIQADELKPYFAQLDELSNERSRVADVVSRLGDDVGGYADNASMIARELEDIEATVANLGKRRSENLSPRIIDRLKNEAASDPATIAAMRSAGLGERMKGGGLGAAVGGTAGAIVDYALGMPGLGTLAGSTLGGALGAGAVGRKVAGARAAALEGSQRSVLDAARAAKPRSPDDVRMDLEMLSPALEKLGAAQKWSAANARAVIGSEFDDAAAEAALGVNRSIANRRNELDAVKSNTLAELLRSLVPDPEDLPAPSANPFPQGRQVPRAEYQLPEALTSGGIVDQAPPPKPRLPARQSQMQPASQSVPDILPGDALEQPYQAPFDDIGRNLGLPKVNVKFDIDGELSRSLAKELSPKTRVPEFTLKRRRDFWRSAGALMYDSEGKAADYPIDQIIRAARSAAMDPVPTDRQFADSIGNMKNFIQGAIRADPEVTLRDLGAMMIRHVGQKDGNRYVNRKLAIPFAAGGLGSMTYFMGDDESEAATVPRKRLSEIIAGMPKR